MKLAIAVIAFLLPALALAQISDTVAAPNSFTLTLSPQYPQPGGTVVISPQSGTIDLPNSTMKVLVNGKSIYTGNTGAVSATLSAAGLSTAIEVIITSKGQSSTQDITLKPGGVSLVIEPLSSAPALYPGKPLVSSSGTVRVVAMSDFRTGVTTRLDPATLSYAWSIDGVTSAEASGIGQSAVTVSAPLQYRARTVSVTVKSPGGSIAGGDSISITPQNPTLRLYLDDPLQGILFDHALLNSFTLSGSEGTFIAIPYSFSLSGGLPLINWFLNGSNAQTGSEITLRPQGTGKGSAALSVTATRGTDSATDNLPITFGTAKSSGILGL